MFVSKTSSETNRSSCHGLGAVFSAILFFVAVFTSISFMLPAGAEATNPETVISRHIRAVGGRGIIKSVRSFTISGTTDLYGVPGNITIRGIYQDYFEIKVENELFEVVWLRSPAGEYVKTADGVVRELSGLDSEALYALSAIFDYAYIKDMTLPLIPEREDDPEVFTMDTGANFGTAIALDPETHLIKSLGLETGAGGLDVSFGDYKSMDRVKFPGRLIFKGRTTVTVNVETLDINPGLKPCDFPPPVEKRTASFLSGATEVEPGLSRMKGKEGEYIALDVNAGGIGKKLVLDTAWGSPPVIDTRAGECPGDTFEHRAESGGFPLSVSKPMGLTLGSMRNKLTITSPLFVTEDVGGLLGEGVSAKGIIGYTLMAENPVRLDLKGGGLTIYDRDGFTPPEGAKRIRIVVDGGRPVVAGVVDGVSGSFIIDTGFGGFGYVVNKEGFDADGETCAAKSLNVGGIVFEDVELDLVPGDDSLPASTIGGLGLAFLERYEAIFDYRGGVLYLVPKEE